MFAEVFKWCSILSALLPLIAGWSSRRRLLWYYPLAALITDLAVVYVKYVLEQPYVWVQMLFLLGEYLILLFVFKRVLLRNRYVFYPLLLSGLIIFVLTTGLRGIGDFNVACASVFSLSYILLGVAGLYNILQTQKILYLERNWYFWLCSGLILYASGNFLIFLFIDYLRIHDKQLFQNLWIVFRILNITKNIFLSFSLYFMKTANGQLK